MNRQRRSTIVITAMMTALLLLAGGLCFAADGNQGKPGMAGKSKSDYLDAKREMVRKQQEQRITPEKRKAAVEALKAERLRVYRAKQAVQQTPPVTTDDK